MAKKLKKKRRELARAVAFILNHPATPTTLFGIILEELGNYGNSKKFDSVVEIESALRKMALAEWEIK